MAPTRPVRDTFSEPPQVSHKREIPAQLSETSHLSMDEEPQAKRTAFPSVLTGTYDFAPLALQHSYDSQVSGDFSRGSRRLPQDLPPMKTPLATPASSVLSPYE